MTDETAAKALFDYVDRWGNIGIKSTGAMLVNFDDVLYNVDGSSTDPKINGHTWKRLLQSYGIDTPCYVSNDTPSDTSHDNFNVGGHMTPNAEGRVDLGDNSYLMPLCAWHNSKARDGIPFTHSSTLMLRLSGYMQGEIAAFFVARLPSEETHALVFNDGDEWKAANLTQDQASRVLAGEVPAEINIANPDKFVLMERAHVGQDERYFVKSSRLQ